MLPGSANLIGGRGFPVKLHFGRTADEMRFPGAKDASTYDIRSAYWEQAFSPDGGKTWEVNWRMDFTRVQ